MAKTQCKEDPAGLIGLTDRKSLLALRGVGPESEAESVRFHGRRVTKVDRKSCRRKAGAAVECGNFHD